MHEVLSGQKDIIPKVDASGIGLVTALLQERDDPSCRYDEVPGSVMLQPITFATKSISSTEGWNSKLEREALRILHGLEKFHHYCFSH